MNASGPIWVSDTHGCADAALIGGHFVDRLLLRGCRVAPYDNLSTSGECFLKQAVAVPICKAA